MMPEWEPHMPAKDAVIAIGKIMHDSRYWYKDDPNPRNPLTEEERWVAFDDVYEALKKAQERLLDATRSVFKPKAKETDK